MLDTPTGYSAKKKKKKKKKKVGVRCWKHSIRIKPTLTTAGGLGVAQYIKGAGNVTRKKKKKSQLQSSFSKVTSVDICVYRKEDEP